MATSTINLFTSPVSVNELLKVFPAHSGGEDHKAVDSINLEIETGELVTLLGPSGCGKTTTLRMIAGFEYPTSGTIYIGEENITNTPPNKRDVGMVFQSYALFPHLTIFGNVSYGLKIKGLSKKEVSERVGKVLELMHLEDFADRTPSQLSGGEQQRVALARAIVTEPKVLLFDEPLSNLDAKLRVYMREELRKLQQRLNITSLYVTHDQTEAMAISDKIVIMNEGRIEQVGSPMTIYTKPSNQFVANFMGKANFLEVEIEELDQKMIKVNFEGYTILLENDHNFKPELNSIVHCVVRPEFWFIDSNGKFEGKVLQKVYYGTFMEYEIQLGKQTVTFEDYNHMISGIYHEGDTMSLNLKKGCARVLPFDKSFK